jgi:hypothetical protein
MDSELPGSRQSGFYKRWLAFERAGLWPNEESRAEVLRHSKMLYAFCLEEEQADRQRDGNGR